MCYFFRVENLAFEKPVWEQYPWPDKNKDFGSENAVDGLYSDRRAQGGQCTISNGGKYTATLRVDLGEVASISYINIYYRTDNLQGMLIVVCTNLVGGGCSCIQYDIGKIHFKTLVCNHCGF